MKKQTFEFLFSLCSTTDVKWSVVQLALETLSAGPQLEWDEATKKVFLTMVSSKFGYSSEQLNGKPRSELYERNCSWINDQKFPDFMIETCGEKMLTDQLNVGSKHENSFLHVLLDKVNDNNSIYDWKTLDRWVERIDHKHFSSWTGDARTNSSFAYELFSMSQKNSDLRSEEVSLPFLVNHVSHHMNWKALSVDQKISLSRLFTLPQQWDHLLGSGFNPDTKASSHYDRSIEVPLWWMVLSSNNSQPLVDHLTQWAQKHRPDELLKLRSAAYFKDLKGSFSYSTIESIKASIRAEKDWDALVDEDGKNALMWVLEKSKLKASHMPVKKMEKQLAMRDNAGRSPAYYLLIQTRLDTPKEWCSLILQRPALDPVDGKGLLVQLANHQKSIALGAPLLYYIKQTKVDDWFAGSDQDIEHMVNFFALNPDRTHIRTMASLANAFGDQINNPHLLGYLALCCVANDLLATQQIDKSYKLTNKSYTDNSPEVCEQLISRGALLPPSFNQDEWKKLSSHDHEEYKSLLANLQANALSQEVSATSFKAGPKKKM